MTNYLNKKRHKRVEAQIVNSNSIKNPVQDEAYFKIYSTARKATEKIKAFM